MKKFLQILVLAVFFCLALGQLTRVLLTPQISFYFHDLLILLFLISALFYLFFSKSVHARFIVFCQNKISSILSTQPRFLSFLILILTIVVLSWTTSKSFSFATILYVARLGAYLSFVFLSWFLKLFSFRQWRRIFLSFFIIFTLLGLAQYFLLPDTSFLENLGWDDHYYRLIGTWFDPAFTGLVFVFGLIFFYFNVRKINRFWFWSLALTFFLGLVLTYSRSSYLSAFVVFFIIAISQTLDSRQKKITWDAQKFSFHQALIFLIFTCLSFLLVCSLLFLAHKYPSDSTNLLRTNSIVIRLEMLQQQLSSFTIKDWLIGRGFFIPLTTPNNSNFLTSSTSSLRLVAPFPDNFFILILSFFGLPLALIFFSYFFLFLKYCWQTNRQLFYFSLALLVNAQFNQSFFHPFVVLLFAFLFIFTFNQKNL